MIDPKNSPDYTCADYDAMRPEWQLVGDLLAGERRIKQRKYAYLPKEPREHDDDYARRLALSVFYEDFGATIEGLSGMVFRRPPQLGADVPKLIQADLENVDQAGTHWQVFAQEVFDAALSYGHTFVVVDMPPPLPAGSTLADERASGRRPYWIHYLASSALNWRTVAINGQTVLARITFREVTTEAAGDYGEKEVTRFRVWRLPVAQGPDGKWQVVGFAQWALFEKRKDQPGGDRIVPVDAGESSLDRIPVRVCYGQKLGYLESRPPLIGLARLNVAHYQSTSDQRNILHVVRVPVLNIAGGTEQEISWAARSILFTPQGSEVKWLEHEGKAIEAGRLEGQDLEMRMARLGLGMLAPDRASGQVTATQSIIESSGKTSRLSRAALSLRDCLEGCLEIQAQYRGLDFKAGGSVNISDNFLGLTLDPLKIQQFLTMRQQGDITRETLWQVLINHGELPEEFSAESEAAALDTESLTRQTQAETVASLALRSFNRGQ